MARSKLDEHKLRDVKLEVLPIGDTVRRRPVRDRAHPPHALDPGRLAASRSRRRWAPSSSPATTSSTRRRSAARRPTWRAWPSSAARACCCCAATPRTSTARASARASRSSARTWTACSAAARAASSSPASRRTSTASSRSCTPRRPNGRKVALVGRSMRKNVNIGRSLGHIDIPEGMLLPPREIDQWADEKIVVISTGSQGEPLSALRRMAYRDHPQVELKRGRHGGLLGHADPGQRARGQRDDRPALPHRLRGRDRPRRADPRLRPRLRGGGQDDDQPHAAEVRDAGPRRLQADAASTPSSPRRSASRARTSSAPRTARRWRSTPTARGSGRRCTAGHDLRRRRRHRRRRRRRAARPADAVRRRHLHHRGHRLRAGRLVRRPARGPRPRRAVPRGQRRRSSRSCARRSRTRSTARPSSRSPRPTCWSRFLHDDLATFIYDRLKRRPMVLPVVVEV